MYIPNNPKTTPSVDYAGAAPKNKQLRIPKFPGIKRIRQGTVNCKNTPSVD